MKTAEAIIKARLVIRRQHDAPRHAPTITESQHLLHTTTLATPDSTAARSLLDSINEVLSGE